MEQRTEGKTGVSQLEEVPRPRSIRPGEAFSTLDTLSGGSGKRREVADWTESLPCSDILVPSGEDK